MEAVGEYGGLDLSQTARLSDVAKGYTYFGDGDVVVAKITPCFENWKGALATGLVNGLAFGTTELHVLRCEAQVDERFLLYLTFSSAFRGLGAAEMSGAAGQKRVPASFVDNLTPAIPPLNEQHAIAAHLDRETQRINALVDKKRRLIERLEECRTALITRTVTRGLPPEAARAADLDPSPHLKPSGVEWLGDVPERWEVKKLRFVASTNDETLSDGEHPLRPVSYVDISSVDSTAGIVHTEEMVFDDAPSRARRLVQDGDTIVSTVRTYLRAIAPVRSPPADMVVSTGFAVIRPLHVDPGFASWALREYGFVEEIVACSTGVSYPAINASKIRDLPIPLPPLAEQRAIAAFLDRETEQIDALRGKAETAIERLQEHRTALITAAVTGKIDVRDAAPEPVAATTA